MPVIAQTLLRQKLDVIGLGEHVVLAGILLPELGALSELLVLSLVMDGLVGHHLVVLVELVHILLLLILMVAIKFIVLLFIIVIILIVIQVIFLIVVLILVAIVSIVIVILIRYLVWLSWNRGRCSSSSCPCWSGSPSSLPSSLEWRLLLLQG